MRVIFFCGGFSVSNLRLQPWLTLSEVGQRLAARGHDVMLATDCSEDAAELPVPVQVFPSLRGTHSSDILRWLEARTPDRVVTSVTPFSLATAAWHGQLSRGKAWGYLAYALYSGREFKTAWPYLTPRDRWSYGRNLLVPGWLWCRHLRQRFAGVICQSGRTAQRLGLKNTSLTPSEGERARLRETHSALCHLPSAVSETTCIIPPGIDLNAWRPAEPPAQKPSSDTFLYLGSARPIRGYTVLLEAMKRLPGHIKLRVLARGLNSAGEGELKRGLEACRLTDRVTVIGGWQTAEQLKAEIQSALAVVLPFVLVPSEVPVSVLEVIGCGTPVIVTDIDGLPETVGGAGVVVPPADATRLAEAMLALADGPRKVAALRQACLRRRETFRDWDAVAEGWAAALRL